MRLCGLLLILSFGSANALACPDIFDFQTKRLGSSQTVSLCDITSDKPALIVNTASQCGFTPQFKELQQLHEQYGSDIAVIGFPSDDFNQEYSDEQEISSVCHANFGVTFTMVWPSSVTGESANKLFKKLIEKSGQSPAWNFNKYLVTADGNSVQHFASKIGPLDQPLLAAVANAISTNQ